MGGPVWQLAVALPHHLAGHAPAHLRTVQTRPERALGFERIEGGGYGRVTKLLAVWAEELAVLFVAVHAVRAHLWRVDRREGSAGVELAHRARSVSGFRFRCHVLLVCQRRTLCRCSRRWPSSRRWSATRRAGRRPSSCPPPRSR